MGRLIDTDELLNMAKRECDEDKAFMVRCLVARIGTARNVVHLPCKVGDTLWGIKVYKNFLVAKKGTVREMYFTKDMKLAIGLYGVCRGEFGKKVFRTKEETEQAIMDMGYVRGEANPSLFRPKGE